MGVARHSKLGLYKIRCRERTVVQVLLFHQYMEEWKAIRKHCGIFISRAAVFVLPSGQRIQAGGSMPWDSKSPCRILAPSQQISGHHMCCSLHSLHHSSFAHLCDHCRGKLNNIPCALPLKWSSTQFSDMCFYTASWTSQNSGYY